MTRTESARRSRRDRWLGDAGVVALLLLGVTVLLLVTVAGAWNTLDPHIPYGTGVAATLGVAVAISAARPHWTTPGRARRHRGIQWTAVGLFTALTSMTTPLAAIAFTTLGVVVGQLQQPRSSTRTEAGDIGAAVGIHLVAVTVGHLAVLGIEAPMAIGGEAGWLWAATVVFTLAYATMQSVLLAIHLAAQSRTPFLREWLWALPMHAAYAAVTTTLAIGLITFVSVTRLPHLVIAVSVASTAGLAHLLRDVEAARGPLRALLEAAQEILSAPTAERAAEIALETSRSVLQRSLTLSPIDHPTAAITEQITLPDGSDGYVLFSHRWGEREGSVAPRDLQVAATLSGLLASGMQAATVRDRHERDALHDPLTGLANRRHLEEQAIRVLERAARTGDAVAVLYFDLDGFKPVNDEHGHETGDQLLRDVASALGQHARPTDLTARLGGDEFAVVVALEPDDDAREIARRLQRGIDERLRYGVTASVGTATYPVDAISFDGLLRRADQRMYANKELRR